MSDDRDPSSEGCQDTQVFAWTHTHTYARFLLLHVSPHLQPSGAIIVIIIAIMSIMTNVNLTTIC